jgi:hypothetical protein
VARVGLRRDPRRARRKPALRGVANPPDPSTQVLHVDPPTAAVFVDRSGRRKRRVRRAAYWLAALALLVVALIWLALGIDAFGMPAVN